MGEDSRVAIHKSLETKRMLTIVTGWSPNGWREYAHRFASTMPKFFPVQTHFVAYVEEISDEVPDCIEQRYVTDIPGCKWFLDKYREDKQANGRAVQPNWKQSAKDRGYNFRYDAWKFSRQGFIPLAASLQCETDYMAWFDADVVAHAYVPDGFIESLLPKDKDVAFLGRAPKYSEIGFQLYDVRTAGPAMFHFSSLYSSENIFSLKEWHSAYAFDWAVKNSGVRAHDLTPGGTGNVWMMSPLARYTDHLKGKRKNA